MLYYTLLCNSKQGIDPGAAIRYAPDDGSSTVAKIAADLRPSADWSAVRTSLVAGVAKLQAASVPTAVCLSYGAVGQTDGRIAQNPPYGGGIGLTTTTRTSII